MRRSLLFLLFSVLALAMAPPAGAMPTETPVFDTMWGSLGSGTGQFQGPAAVAVDAVANVYVADSGNNRIQKFKDATPPVVSCSASPSSLWPPNHKLRAVTMTVTVSDGGSGPAGFKLLQVTSSEPDNGLGDGDTADDIQSGSWAPLTPPACSGPSAPPLVAVASAP